MREYEPLVAAIAVVISLGIGWCGTFPPYRSQPSTVGDMVELSPEIPGKAGQMALREAEQLHREAEELVNEETLR